MTNDRRRVTAAVVLAAMFNTACGWMASDPGSLGSPRSRSSALSQPAAPVVQGAKVAPLAGGGAITPTGAYEYTLPIEVPPGRGGVQPALTLSYSSHSPDGAAGVGWQLGGFSEIAPCEKTLATEHVVDGIHHKNDDAFCMDGQKLVQIAPGEYRTENDVFAKIVSFSTQPPAAPAYPPPDACPPGQPVVKVINFTQPCTSVGGTENCTTTTCCADTNGTGCSQISTNCSQCYNPPRNLPIIGFHVYLKNGRIREYNANVDGQHDLAGVVFLLTQERDRFGNAMSFEYSLNTSGKVEYYPKRIVYTQTADLNGAITGAGQREIDFTYEGRPESPFTMIAGNKYALTQRLKTITAKAPNLSNASSVWTYTLDYDPSATDRSLLSKVTRCGADGGCDLAKLFSWTRLQPKSAGVASHFTPYPLPPLGPSTTRLTLDVDGDGKSELLIDTTPKRTMLQTTSGSFTPLNTKVVLGGLNNISLDEAVAGDFYGDGNDYLIAGDTVSPGFYNIYQWSPGLNDFFNNFFVDMTYERFFNNTWSSALFAVDLDGDGHPDLVKLGHDASEQKLPAGGVPEKWLWTYALGMGGFGFQPEQSVQLPFLDPNAVIGDPLFGQTGGVHHPTAFVADLGNHHGSVYLGAEGVAKPPAQGGSQMIFHGVMGVPDGFQPTLPSLTQSVWGLESLGDVNGDGLADDLRFVTQFQDPAVPPTLCVQGFNTGDSKSPFGAGGPCIAPPDGNVNLDDYSLNAVDLDGDGAAEILLSDKSVNQTFVTTYGYDGQLSIETLPFIPNAFGDFNGDGLVDLAVITHNNNATQISVYMNDTPIGRADLITAVWDESGAPARETIGYTRVFSPSPDVWFCQYPQRCSRAGMIVANVHNVGQGSDLNTFRSRYYNYDVPASDQRGRGFLGFHTVRVWDPSVPSETITTYDNLTDSGDVYVGAFRPQTITTVVPIIAQQFGQPPAQPSSVAAARVMTVTTSYQKDSLNGGANFFIHPIATQSHEYETGATIDWTANAKVHITLSGLTRRVTQLDASATYAYDSYGNVTAAISHAANGVTTGMTSIWDYQYASGWLINLPSHTESNASATFPFVSMPRTTDYVHDPHGFTTVIDIEKNNPDIDVHQTVSFIPDAFGNVQDVTNQVSGEPARTTHIDYDAAENMFPVKTLLNQNYSQHFIYEPSLGVPVASDDFNGVQTQLRYDDLGRLIQVLPAAGATITTTYSPRVKNGLVAGTMVLTQSGTGAQSSAELDELGRTVRTGQLGFDGTWVYSRNQYDIKGLRIANHYPDQGGIPANVTQYRYDSLSRLLQEQFPNGKSVNMTYTGLLRSDVIDPLGHQRYVSRDGAGRVASSANLLGGQWQVMTFRYGDFNQLEQVIDPLNNMKSLSYDHLGRAKTSADPDTGSATLTYNGFGEVRNAINSAGDSVDYYHDVLGRVWKKHDANGDTLFKWDTKPFGLGKLGNTSSSDNITIDYTYDQYSRLITKNWTVGAGGPSFAVDIGYDVAGRPSTVTYPSAPGMGPRFTTFTSYNPRGYLSEIDDVTNGAWSAKTLWQVNQRDYDGQLLEGTFGNGLGTLRSYDPLMRRLASVKDGTIINSPQPGGGLMVANPVLDLSFGHDDDGQISSRTDATFGRIESFGNDEAHRLTNWTLSAAGKQLTTEYHYDVLGNMQTRFENGVMKESNTYDAANGHPHRLVTSFAGSFGYDGSGRQNSAPGRTIDIFTSFDLPQRITSAAGVTKLFYDAGGARVQKQGPSGEIIALDSLYERHAPPAPNNGIEHIFKIAGVAQVRYNEATQTAGKEYLHSDQSGSTAAVSDSAGGLKTQLYYEPFGRRINADASLLSQVIDEVGFTGQSHDDELGLIDMHARAYDPSQHRFLTGDPVVSLPLSAQAYNPYSYVLNNPINLTDPTGMDPFEDTMGDSDIAIPDYGFPGDPTVTTDGGYCAAGGTCNVDGTTSANPGTSAHKGAQGKVISQHVFGTTARLPTTAGATPDALGSTSRHVQHVWSDQFDVFPYYDENAPGQPVANAANTLLNNAITPWLNAPLNILGGVAQGALKTLGLVGGLVNKVPEEILVGTPQGMILSTTGEILIGLRVLVEATAEERLLSVTAGALLRDGEMLAPSRGMNPDGNSGPCVALSDGLEKMLNGGRLTQIPKTTSAVVNDAYTASSFSDALIEIEQSQSIGRTGKIGFYDPANPHGNPGHTYTWFKSNGRVFIYDAQSGPMTAASATAEATNFNSNFGVFYK